VAVEREVGWKSSRNGNQLENYERLFQMAKAG